MLFYAESIFNAFVYFCRQISLLMNRRYFIRLSYNGRRFFGWQKQPGHYTVQQCLEEHFSTFLRQQIHIIGAGRTDTGVHAKNYFAHAEFSPGKMSRNDMVYKLNRFLPEDVVIHKIYPVVNEAHARFDAISRSYEYVITKEKNPFHANTAYFYPGTLDLDKMNMATEAIMGEKDFGSFAKAGSDVKNYICTVSEAYWEEQDDFIIFKITANRFLRNMVRAVAGTLLDVGRGYTEASAITSIIESGSRQDAGTSMPAHGLFLVNIEYPPEIFLNHG